MISSIIVLIYLILFDLADLTFKNIKKVFKSKGIILGVFLYLSYFFQTFGLQITAPSNAAFVTSLSVLLVPLFLIVTGKKLSKYTEKNRQ